MVARIEHANITHPDIDGAIAFLSALDPTFRVLHDSGSHGAYRWVHIGRPDSYIALEDPHEDRGPGRARRYTDFGVNHIGFVVDDVAAAAKRLQAAGYDEGYQADAHPARIRRYFVDGSGFEWELVQYLTDRDEDRFSYSD